MNRVNIKPLLSAQRKAIAADSELLVSKKHMFNDKHIPLLLTPTVDGVDIIEWCEINRKLTADLLLDSRAILFRGFGIDNAAKLARFSNVTSMGSRVEYKDRSAPRYAVGDNVYVSTIYPAEQSIQLHNEGTYWKKWPRKIFFCCERAADTGGETPIADVRKVYARIDARVREEFERRNVLYIRNFNDGFGLSWQEVYQTREKSDVENYCRLNDIEVEWKRGDKLRTRQVRPAVRVHPETGEKLWFNHGAVFNVNAHDAEYRKVLCETFAEAELPFHTKFGDGTSIPAEWIAEIQSAYAAEKVMFSWMKGDVLMLDNMTIAHAREPYTGERSTLVAMTEPYRDDGV